MAKKQKYTVFDAADYIKSLEDAGHYLTAAAAEHDAKHLANALGDVARARSIGKIAQKSGLTRAALYKALSDNGNPSLDTALRVLLALGLTIEVKPAPVAKKRKAA